jgi:tight adherence protein B
MIGITTKKGTSLEAESLLYYANYVLNTREIVTCVIVSALLFGSIGYLFYQKLLVAFIFSCISLWAPKFRKKQLIRMRKSKLNVQFRQALACLSSCLTAGKSVESAFREALFDLKVLYPDPTAFIIKEFQIILRRIENGEPIEAAVREFANRADMEDVTGFSDALSTCKRTGGNLVEVMKRTSALIGEKLEIQQEITVMIAQKKFESGILLLAPFCLVALLCISSPEYMNVLYQGLGTIIMTACLILLVCCYGLIRKIMNIRV